MRILKISVSHIAKHESQDGILKIHTRSRGIDIPDPDGTTQKLLSSAIADGKEEVMMTLNVTGKVTGFVAI